MLWQTLLITALTLCPTDLAELKGRLRHEDSDVRARAVKALGEMNRLEATRLLPDVLLDSSPYVRDWCFVALGKIRDGASRQFLISEGMRRREARIRLDLAEWAGEERIAGAVPELIRLLKDKSTPVRLAAADSLASIGDPPAAPAIEARLKEKSHAVRAQMLLAFGRLARDGAAGAVAEGGDDPAWQVRVAALTLSRGCLPRDEALEAGRKGIRDRTWPVRAAAIEMLASLKHPGGIPHLIDELASEGRLRQDAYDALVRLTGKEIPPDLELWRAWWEVAREGFEPPARETKRSGSRRTRTRIRYHGIPIVSNRIAFVLDLSGSMREPAGEPSDVTKLTAARDELSRVIGGLGRKAVFNIYFYNESVIAWRPWAVRASRQNRAEALAFVEDHQKRST